MFEGSTDGAYYNFANDKISVPSREAFNSNSSFLASLLHEMGHSTAPALNRQMTGDMRSKEYAHEEIVAELSSIFSSVDLAVKAETDPEAAGYGEHVAYLEFWKGRLDSVAGTDEYEATKEELCDDFFAAASQASQATDFIIDRYEQEVGHPAAGKEFEQKFGCNPSSVLAYEAVHPEMCTRFIARRKKTEMISYRLPAEAVKAGMKEEQVCPLAYAGHSRVAYFDVFMQGTGKKRHWEDVDFEALTEKFDKAAEKGKRAKMQPKARLDAKKTCVEEAMRVMREQTDNSGDKEQENQK